MDNVGASLQQQIMDLTERLAAVEAQLNSPLSTSPAKVQATATSSSPSVLPQFWALEGLQERLDGHPETEAGAVMIVGSMTLPSGAPVAWQESAASAGLLEQEWTDLASTFSALAHPVRVELLRQILLGKTSTAELALLENLGTTGQLHHHLRQLVTAGWVRPTTRGNYEVPTARVVPLLASVIGARS